MFWGGLTTPKENARRICIYFKASLIPSNEIISGTRMFMPDNRAPSDPARASLVNTRCQTRGGESTARWPDREEVLAGQPRWQRPAGPPTVDPADICGGLSSLPGFLPTVCAFDIQECQGVINIQLRHPTTESHI